MIITVLLIFTGFFLEQVGISLKEDTLIFFTLEAAFAVIFGILCYFIAYKEDEHG